MLVQRSEIIVTLKCTWCWWKSMANCDL